MKRRVHLYCRVEIVWLLFEMAVQFTVGEKFARCSDLEQKVADFQRINHVDIYKRDSRSIDSAIRRKSISAVKVSSLDNKIRLKYYEIRYACIHGGRRHISVSTGQRKASTCRSDCPFSMVVGLSDDGNSLVVKSLNDQHNHDISACMFSWLVFASVLFRYL